MLALACATASLTTAMAQTEPGVTTDTRFLRGSTEAFGRATFKVTGTNSISERGFCWSEENKEPTIDDNKSTEYISNNGLIFRMKNLKPSTKYYARAYAKGKDGSVGYGNVIKIVTIPKGTATWSYDNGADEAANARINSAVASCIDYWNRYINIHNFHLNVHYGAGTPTADCSYGGWMRVGPNASYQRTGTIMHEALHGIGVGTHEMWNGATTPLRSGSGTGQWLGDRATEMLRFWDNNATSTFSGDGTHIWPYGINGAHEDTGSEVLYIGNSLMAQALGEDGLPHVGGFGTPYYSFDQEDDQKYYIKNESETYGLLTSFLVETEDHKLQWKAMKAEDALKNDAAAWYVTFTPDNQYYQLRNAATGYYVTYAANGANGIKTIQRTKPTAAENFQLMRARNDIKSASGSLLTSARGYWIIRPDNSTLNPPVLQASANGTTTAVARVFTNAATQQRWVILNEKQAKDMENSNLIASKDAYNKKKEFAQEMLATAHIEIEKDADATLTETISRLDAVVEAADNVADINTATNDLFAATKTFLKSVCTADMEKPFVLTSLLVNPDFKTDNSGWTNPGKWGSQTVEYYEKSISTLQTILSMPRGTYEAKMQGFQRPGSYTNVYNDYKAGNNNVNARFYITNTTAGAVNMKNIMEDVSMTSLHADDKKMTDGSYIPNTMASAAAHFQKGYYENTTSYFMTNDGAVRIGIIGTGNTESGFWAIFTNFRLYYYGPLTKEDVAKKIEESKGVKGDANGDGVITMDDANMVVNHYLGNQPEGINLNNADANSDGNITMDDANIIVNKYLGSE